MPDTPLIRIKTISEYHKIMGLAKPEHPLVSVINFEDMKRRYQEGPVNFVYEFYSVSLKRNFNGNIKYGQQQYDFDEGIMFFISPGQVLGIEKAKNEALTHSGWLLLIHPDFLWNTILSKKIKQYEYFDYAVHEALFLSEKEEGMIVNIMQNIRQEYHSNIDNFSQDVIIAQVELLLTYSERFYQRQFITRKIINHSILSRLEELIENYFSSEEITEKGLPTVQYISELLNISPNYLSRLLKTLTGQSTQQFIHDKLIETAKEKLSTTNLSVNEIAYALGFEHAQSFNKLFKTKTKFTPLKFRQSFN